MHFFYLRGYYYELTLLATIAKRSESNLAIITKRYVKRMASKSLS